LNGWTNAIISILSSWEVNSLQLPTRTSSKPCLWLYTWSDFSWVPISVWTILEPWTRLYAKFECNDDDKTIWNWSDCVTKVSLSLMDGEELFDFQEIPSWGTWHRPENPESKPGLGFDNWYTLPEGWELFDFDIPIT
jgi:hypothetical protein